MSTWQICLTWGDARTHNLAQWFLTGSTVRSSGAPRMNAKVLSECPSKQTTNPPYHNSVWSFIMHLPCSCADEGPQVNIFRNRVLVVVMSKNPWSRTNRLCAGYNNAHRILYRISKNVSLCPHQVTHFIRIFEILAIKKPVCLCSVIWILIQHFYPFTSFAQCFSYISIFLPLSNASVWRCPKVIDQREFPNSWGSEARFSGVRNAIFEGEGLYLRCKNRDL